MTVNCSIISGLWGSLLHHVCSLHPILNELKIWQTAYFLLEALCLTGRDYETVWGCDYDYVTVFHPIVKLSNIQFRFNFKRKTCNRSTDPLRRLKTDVCRITSQCFQKTIVIVGFQNITYLQLFWFWKHCNTPWGCRMLPIIYWWDGVSCIVKPIAYARNMN